MLSESTVGIDPVERLSRGVPVDQQAVECPVMVRTEWASVLSGRTTTSGVGDEMCRIQDRLLLDSAEEAPGAMGVEDGSPELSLKGALLAKSGPREWDLWDSV